MVLDYIPFTFVREASYQLGVSVKKTSELVSKGLLETSLTGGKELFNNKVLIQYINEHGGVKERYRDLILQEIEKKQVDEIIRSYKIVKLTKSNQTPIKVTNKYCTEEKEVIRKYNKETSFNIEVDWKGEIIDESNYDEPTFKYFSNTKDIERFYFLVRWKRQINRILKVVLEYESNRKVFDDFCNNDIEFLALSEKYRDFSAYDFLVKNHTKYLVPYNDNIKEYNEINFLKYSDIKEIILRCRRRLNYKI